MMNHYKNLQMDLNFDSSSQNPIEQKFAAEKK
jgi:hypothetical protein